MILSFVSSGDRTGISERIPRPVLIGIGVQRKSRLIGAAGCSSTADGCLESRFDLRRPFLLRDASAVNGSNEV
jgi:hypothetical protein